MMKRAAFFLGWALALFSLAALGKVAPPREVIVRDLDLKDAKRGRAVPLRIYYPKGEGELPVLIFSHGLGGSRESCEYLGRHWAEAGYIVLAPTHVGSDGALFRKGRVFHNLRALKKAADDPENLVNRPADVKFLIDSFGEIASAVPELRGRMAMSAIGVGGHSFGAYTTLALAGARVELPGKGIVPLADPRIHAFLALSPQGEGRFGFRSDSWQDIKRPLFIITGSKDKGLAGELPSWRLTAYEKLPAGDKYLGWLEGSNHFSFAGLPRQTASAERFQEYVKRLSTAFWDAYLKKDANGKAYLLTGPLPQESRGEVRVESK
jgi:predicted dienelactone hydrolase